MRMRHRERPFVRAIRAAGLPVLPVLVTLSLSGAARADLLDGTEAKAVAGGVPTLDIVRVTPGTPGVPLKFGNVIPKSERVTLAGRALQPGVDYAMDYVAGVVYLYRTQREGDTLAVDYRYDRSKSPVASAGMMGFSGADGSGGASPFMRLSLLPGAGGKGPGAGGLGLAMGLGVTERAADGSVLRSNLYGTNNDLAFGSGSGGGSLTGAYLVGQRSKVDMDSGMSFDGASKNGAGTSETGDSKFLVQAFRLGLAGGTLKIDQQDVSSNFVGFSALRGGAFSDDRLTQLQKERGLTRTGMALDGARMLGGALSFGQRSVSDGKGEIAWQNLGFAAGGFSFNAETRKIAKDFARFKDVAEADREQMAKEAGLERANFNGRFKSKTATMGFTSTGVTDSASGKGILRREATIDTARFGFSFGEQTVDEGFSRFNSLLGQEKGSWGQEAGMNRQWMTLRASGFLGAELNFSRASAGDKTGETVAESASLRGKTWSLEHVGSSSEKGFARMGSLSGDELGKRAAEIAGMYNTDPFSRDMKPGGGDVNALKANAGVARTFDKLSLTPDRGAAKGMKVEASQLRLDGLKDGATVQTVKVEGRTAAFRFRKMDLGADFNELTGLMGIEQQRLGGLKGLQRTDAQLDLKLAPKSSLSVARMAARTKDGEASRTKIAYADPKLQFTMALRNVDRDMKTANLLVDDERDALAGLRGYNQKEIALNWQAFKNVKLEFQQVEGTNAADDRDRDLMRMAFDYRPDAGTSLGYRKFSQSETDRSGLAGGGGLKTVFSETIERMSFAKRIGSSGIAYVQETRDYAGTDAKRPDSTFRSVALDTKVSRATTLSAVRATTEFSDGTNETTQTNAVQTAINKRVGVSVSDTKIDREGDANDETKRNYGVYLDFGGGVRLSYGYIRALTGEDKGLRTNTLSFGKGEGVQDAKKVGEVGNANVNGTEVAVGSGANTWDDQEGRVQEFNNVRLKTTKPFSFLWMNACALSVNMDTASDKSVWIRENQQYSFEGRIAGNPFGVEYRGQTDPSGQRAVDRTLRFKTDAKGKAPLSASVMLKERTLPTSEIVAIRDVSLTARPARNIEVTNQIVTNPEVYRSDVLLGSTTRGDRANRWKIDFHGRDSTLGGMWEELRNEGAKTMSRTAGFNLSLFERSGSPLKFFYGFEQQDASGTRRTIDRYSVSFDQRPGPNQIFSLLVGNLAYSDTRDPNLPDNNLSVRLNYQLRF